jgi:hypothetical protein
MKHNILHKTIFLGIALTSFLSICFANKSEKPQTTQIIFPRGVTVNVGQVGWMGGSSLDPIGGPWRAGIRRDFDVRDYQPIVEVGKALGVRFMSLFILGEMDRLNILGEYPTSNPQGEKWDNAANIGPRQIEIMDYVKDNAANMEFGITGVLHEYWQNGVKNRAEWFDVENQKPRDEKIIRNNVELLKRLMAQYGITPEKGHSFPESFISYGFYFNPGAEYSLGNVLSENGVKYANTPFSSIRGLNHPPRLGGGFDNGVLLLDRHNHGNSWYQYAQLPDSIPSGIQTVVVESHWANWLAVDDHVQPNLNRRWINYLRKIQADRDHYLSKNTEQLYSQWLYKKYTKVTESKPGKVIIDNRAMINDAYEHNLLGNIVLAVELKEGEHVSSATIDDKPIAAYYEAEGFGYIYLPPLSKKNYTLEYKIGDKKIGRSVHNNGTYNVYKVIDHRTSLEIDLKMYGEQVVEIHTSKPTSVISSNENLLINSFSYDDERNIAYLTINGRNIQGERGTISLKY